MFEGSIVALITPFHESGKIDLPAFVRLLDHVREGGSSGVVVAGTTGESATLEEAEFQALLECAVAQVGGTMKVLAGTGSPATDATIKRTRLARSLGAHGALVVTPSYNRPTAAGLEAHYRMIAQSVELPIVLYNVPSRTAVDLQPETVARLARLDTVVAIKEAVPGVARARELLRRAEGQLQLLSGDDESCAEVMLAGAAGVVSVAANLAPAHMARLCHFARQPQEQKTLALQERLRPLYAYLGIETNPIPVKWGAYEMGLAGSHLRLPLLPLDQQHQPGLKACLEQLGLMAGMEPSF